MVTMARAHYPNLVREFYANITLKSDPYRADIGTFMKGVHIHLTCAILDDILGIRDEGHSASFGHASTRVTEDPMWVYEEALSRFRVHAQGLVKRMVKANGLEGTWKVAALLIGQIWHLNLRNKPQTCG